MDKSKIQMGMEVGFNKQRDYRYNLGPVDECISRANEILKKYDPSLHLKLIRKSQKPKRSK